MSAATSTKPNVEAAIRNVFSSFTAAWDKHDAKTLASLFVEDGDLINPEGRVARGRHEIEKLLQEEHSSRFQTTRMNMTVSHIRTLTPDIAIVTDNCELSGVHYPGADGPQVLKVVATFVLQNEGATWRIVSARPMVPVTRPQ